MKSFVLAMTTQVEAFCFDFGWLPLSCGYMIIDRNRKKYFKCYTQEEGKETSTAVWTDNKASAAFYLTRPEVNIVSYNLSLLGQEQMDILIVH